MTKLTKRSMLRSSFGVIGAAALGAPYIANAQAKTATVSGNRNGPARS